MYLDDLNSRGVPGGKASTLPSLKPVKPCAIGCILFKCMAAEARVNQLAECHALM